MSEEQNQNVVLNKSEAPLSLGKEAKEAPEKNGMGRRRGPLWKKILKGSAFFVLGLLLFVVVVLAGGYGVLQTQVAQDFLREKLNASLGGGDGVRVELASLSGGVPFDMRAGLKLSDAGGVWMDLPDCRFRLDVSSERISVALSADDATLFRQPVLAPPTDEEPAPPAPKPLSRKDLRELLKGLGRKAEALPSWVPAVAVDKITVSRLRIERPVFDAATEEGGLPSSFASALELGLEVGLAVAPRSGLGASPAWFDPALSGKVALSAVPLAGKDPAGAPFAESALALLPDVAFAGARLTFDLAGTLGDPAFSLTLESPSALVSGTAIETARASVALDPHALPSLSEGKEAGLSISCSAVVNKLPVSVSLPVFAAFKDEGLVAGFKDLSLSLPGVSLAGGVKALFPPAVLGSEQEIAEGKAFASKPFLPLPMDVVPLLDGGVRLNVASFDLLKGLVPGVGVSGALDAGVTLSPAGEQALGLAVKTKSLGVSLGGQPPMSIKDFALSCDARALYGQPEGKVGLGVNSFKGAGLSVSSIKLDLAGGIAAGVDYSLGCAGDIRSKLAGHFAPGEVKLSALDVHYPKLKLGVQSASPSIVRYTPDGVSVKNLHLKLVPGGSLRLEGDFGKSACKASGKLEGIRFSAYRSIVPQLPDGALDVSLQLKGTPERPVGGVVARLSGLKVPGVELAPLDVDFKADLGRDAGGNRVLAGVSLPASTLETLGGKSCAVQVRVPMKGDGSPAPDMGGKLQGKVEYAGDVSKLWKLAGQADRFLSGDIDLRCALGGTLNAPDLSAVVQFLRGKFKEVEQGLLVEDINLKATLPGGHGRLQDKELGFSLSASDGKKGKLDFAGSAALTGKRISVKGTISDFAPLHRRDLKAVLSGNIAVSGAAESPVITGKINLDQGSLNLEGVSTGGGSFDTLPLEQKTKEEILSSLKKGQPATVKADGKGAKEKGATKEAKAVKPGPGSIDLDFHMPPRFSISGFGLESLWRADLKIKGHLNDVGIMGKIMAVKGSLSLLNRKFVLDTGTVSFFGGTEPFLNIKMVHQASEIEAAVNLQGSPRKLDFSLSSTPEKPQDEIISLILFNKDKNDLSNYELMQLGAAAAKLALFGGRSSGGVMDKIKDVAGIDVVNISSEKGNPKVELGKYLTEKIYVGVEKETGAKGDTAGLVQYEFGPRTSATAKTSGKNTSVGLKWKLDY